MVDHHLRARRRRALGCVLGCFVAAATLASCKGDNRPTAATTSTTTATFSLPSSSSTSTSTTTAVPAEEAAVRSAYEAASRAFIDAAAVPDPSFPALAVTHTGPRWVQRRDVLLGLKADGRAIRYPEPSVYRIAIKSVEINDDVARLEVCGVDDGQRVVVASGQVLADGVLTVLAKAAMRKVDGGWRLAERVKEQEWEGVAGCAA